MIETPSTTPPDTPRGVEAIKRTLTTLPNTPGVYRMLNDAGEVLYVGKARSLKNRVVSYTQLAQMPARLQRMVLATCSMEIVTTGSEAEALLLEANLIKQFQPKYNVLLKDDKSFPFIHINTAHAYPRISKYRGARAEKGDYFGPFVSAGAVHDTITTLQKAFLLRPCSDNVFKNRERPCLQYQIKRCSAPCVGLISEPDYADLISQAKQFLSGQSREIQEQLEAEMQTASEKMEFEKAAHLRDRIRALSNVQRQSRDQEIALKDADVMVLVRDGAEACVQISSTRGGQFYGSQHYFPAHTEQKSDEEILAAVLGQYYQRQVPPELVLVSHALEGAALIEEALKLRAGSRVQLLKPERGDKKKVVDNALTHATAALKRHLLGKMANAEMLDEVGKLFGLSAAPERIEVYDNSHVMGAHAVGAMIVAGAEGFDKKSYRQFNIKNTELTPGDDYGMLREVLTRRFKRLLAEEEEGYAIVPDVVLIDGGQGQLTVAVEVLEQLGIRDVHLVSIAKGPDRNAGREWFFQPGKSSFQLPPDAPVLHYLQRLRDEAHRFAIGTHRNKRSRALTTSKLDQIPNIGPARKRALLKHFGSAQEISNASVENIASVDGISKELAEKIYAFFH